VEAISLLRAGGCIVRALAGRRGDHYTGTGNYNNSVGYDDPASCSTNSLLCSCYPSVTSFGSRLMLNMVSPWSKVN
jgi:hypothetical protein